MKADPFKYVATVGSCDNCRKRTGLYSNGVARFCIACLEKDDKPRLSRESPRKRRR